MSFLLAAAVLAATVAAATSAATAVVAPPDVLGQLDCRETQETRLKDAIGSELACTPEVGSFTMHLLQRKASAAVVVADGDGTPPATKNEQVKQSPVSMSPGGSALLQLSSGRDPQDEPYPCKEKPQYCGEPLHCEQRVTKAEKEGWNIEIATGGQPNLRSWCDVRGFAGGIVKECLVNKDLSKAGRITYEEQANNNALEADGSYCFLVGHCDNNEVTNATTLVEAAEMCDKKYGRAGWTTEFGIKDVHSVEWLIKGDVSTTTGFHDRGVAHTFAKLACAMGNYHCDVIYCRENFCNNKYYLKKYGRYRVEEPPPAAALKG